METGLAVCEKVLLVHRNLIGLYIRDNKSTPCKMLKKVVSKAADESKLEAYPQGYVEDFDESRTKLAAFFSILPVASFTRAEGRPAAAGREFGRYWQTPLSTSVPL